MNHCSNRWAWLRYCRVHYIIIIYGWRSLSLLIYHWSGLCNQNVAMGLLRSVFRSLTFTFEVIYYSVVGAMLYMSVKAAECRMRRYRSSGSVPTGKKQKPQFSLVLDLDDTIIRTVRVRVSLSCMLRAIYIVRSIWLRMYVDQRHCLLWALVICYSKQTWKWVVLHIK